LLQAGFHEVVQETSRNSGDNLASTKSWKQFNPAVSRTRIFRLESLILGFESNLVICELCYFATLSWLLIAELPVRSNSFLIIAEAQTNPCHITLLSIQAYATHVKETLTAQACHCWRNNRGALEIDTLKSFL